MTKPLISPPFSIGKSGWPWTSDTKTFPAKMPDGRSWPKISIVTPSYNQGQYLEETIRSVILQNYPNLEYLIMDGGSTDNSLEIISKYKKYLVHWQSGKDEGQADAIAQGFNRATGDILSWLNSDDILLPDALMHIAVTFVKSPSIGAVFGNTLVIDEHSNEVNRYFWPAKIFKYHWSLGQSIGQESCFFSRDIYNRVGGINRNRFFIMDYDLFFRMWETTKFKKIRKFIGGYRIHEEAKNSKFRDVWRKELLEAKEKYGIKELGYFGRRIVNRVDRFQIALERFLFNLES